MKQKKKLISIILVVMFLLLFLNFILQLRVGVKNITHQAGTIINQIEEMLRENEKDAAELIESLKEEYIIRAKAVSYILEHDLTGEVDVDELKKISELLQVDEIHLFDAAGTIYGGTHPEYYGMNLDSGEQMAFFKPMLTNRTLSLCQDMTPNTAESRPMMYALVWREDGAGMVQIGIEPVRLLEEQKKNEVSYLFSYMLARAGNVICAIDRTTGEVIGATEDSYIGSTLAELGIKLSDVTSGKNGFPAEVKGISYYCIFREYGEYYIGMLYGSQTVLDTLPNNMVVYALFLVAASVIMIVAISYYMDKLQRQQKELRLALEKAEMASKSKTNFLFNMSHDIRTPMNAILGLSQIAEKNIDDKEKVLDSLKKLNNAGGHLERLINNVLDMARIEHGKIEFDIQPHHLPSALKAIENLFAVEMQKKEIAFSVHWNIQDEVVFFDKLRMEQIELNLISNAVKYTQNGGTITYTLSQIGPVENGYAVYQGSIKDNGIGMSKEFREHLFELFAREKNSTTSGIQGTGLGLSIIKNLLEQMGGTISCNSEQGKGSEFIFQLPLRVGSESDLPKEAEASGMPQDFSGKRLLLAEDVEINREIVMELLSDYGVIIETAEDGLIAVEKVTQAAPGYYDLILMDVQMPNMDGYTATETIRRLEDPVKANIPIIAMTANAFEEDRQNAMAAGMNGHLAKPMDLSKLVAVLEKYFITKNNA